MGWKLKGRQRYALIEQDSVNLRKHRGTFYIGPRHVKHRSTKQFVEFSYVTAPNFASEKDCRVFAQNSHVAVEIYDYYTKLFDPDYENVSVYDERFAVQYLFKTEPKEDWRDIDAWNPRIQVIPLEDGVEIKKIFDTDYGVESLEISYIIRTGAFLKHKIVFTNKTTDTKTFRVVMKLAGITHNKVKHRTGEDEITAETHIISPFLFVGEDNQHLKLTEYLWSLGVGLEVVKEETDEWTPTTLQDIIFDVHAQGCKVDIIIGNYSLAQEESLVIDPASSTWQVSHNDDDCVYKKLSDFWSMTKTYFIVGNSDAAPNLSKWGSTARFLNVTIPKNATINSAYLKIKASSDKAADNVKSYIKAEDADNPARFTTKANFLARSWITTKVAWDNIPHWSNGTWYTSPDIKSVIQVLVNKDGWQSGNAAVILWEDWDGRSTSGGTVNRSGYSHDGSATDAPKLEVTWTSGGETYEIYKDAVVKTSALHSEQCTFNIHKDAAVASQALRAPEVTFNIPKDAIVQTLASVSIERIINIFKNAVVKAQATFSLESTFNINKNAISQVSATVGIETIFNIVKDAIVKASAIPQIGLIYPLNFDAVVNASATPQLQQTLGISKDAIVVSVASPLIQSTFNISPEAVVKVLAEVSVIKEGEVKVTRLFLLLGNIAIQLTGD